jgi:hypothetical protein
MKVMTAPQGLRITRSVPGDMEVIFRLFDNAILYQQKHGYELWPRFSEQLISDEIADRRHWKILEGDVVACIFSVLYSDPVIWGPERDQEPSVYLHRIAVNPQFKGRHMMLLVRDWAIGHARQEGKQYVRMDTWGNNDNLRAYYTDCGFNYIGRQQLAEVEGLPGHYGGSVLSLFQIEV